MKLRKRRLGCTDIFPSALAMGCAWIGGEHDSDAEAIDAVRCALAGGIDLWDTDPGYMDGRSERRLGDALRGVPRDSYYLGSKVGTHPERRGDLSAAGTRWCFEQSLKTLHTDYLDILLIHDPGDIKTPLAPGGALEEMVRLKEEGRVRAIGLGCRSHRFHVRALETGLMDVILTYKDYTLLDQSAAFDTIPLAQLHDVGLILASALDMGTLGGREPDPAREPRAHAMWQWCRERGRSVRDFALQFALALPIRGVVMSGPADCRQVREVLESATAIISADLWREFADAFGVGPGALGGRPAVGE